MGLRHKEAFDVKRLRPSQLCFVSTLPKLYRGCDWKKGLLALRAALGHKLEELR